MIILLPAAVAGSSCQMYWGPATSDCWPSSRLCRFVLVVAVLTSCCFQNDHDLLRTVAGEDDTECLRAFKSSVVDAHDSLSGWDLKDTSASNICSLVGVTCWNDGDNKVLELKLVQEGLSGRLNASGFSKCESLQSLSLADNSFTGPLPSDFCRRMPYLTSLDLSNNAFSGEIPGDLHKCRYLHALHLEGNHLTGSIPWDIGLLPLLLDLDLSYNALSGPIPSSFTHRPRGIVQQPFPARPFVGNPKLCGPPLSTPCASTSTLIPPSKLSKLVIAGASVLSILLFSGIIASGFACWRSACQSRSEAMSTASASTQQIFGTNSVIRVTWEDLRRATSNFSKSNVVGVGGSSTVYKAILGPSKRTVAVKLLMEYPTRADEDLMQLDSAVRKQFLTELEVLGKLRHRNLVRILSYCYNVTSMAIVLDYMAMGSLDALLHSKVASQHQDLRHPFSMNWKARLRILVNIADGLEYLHRGYDCKCCVIHGDLKPLNVLLDEHMEAHIADFGLASLIMGAVDTASCATPPSQQVVTGAHWWSFGYTAPECAQQGVVSRKSDVFSFGVTALEVMTGERPNSCRLGEEGQSLAEWVGEALTKGAARTVVASTLMRDRDWSRWASDITAALRLACSCASNTPSARPDMHQVASFLRELAERVMRATVNRAELDEKEDEAWILSVPAD